MPIPPSAKDVAIATNSKESDVAVALPLILKAMQDNHMALDPRALAGVLSTVGAECHFKPIKEYGGPAYFTKNYENRKDLGNIHPGDGAKYCGRGLIQITGRANYEKYGKALGIDLVNKPDLALDVNVAVKILVLYFKDHGCDVWSQRGDWRKVRKLVNGGLNGFDVFSNCVYNLLEVLYK